MSYIIVGQSTLDIVSLNNTHLVCQLDSIFPGYEEGDEGPKIDDQPTAPVTVSFILYLYCTILDSFCYGSQLKAAFHKTSLAWWEAGKSTNKSYKYLNEYYCMYFISNSQHCCINKNTLCFILVKHVFLLTS